MTTAQRNIILTQRRLAAAERKSSTVAADRYLELQELITQRVESLQQALVAHQTRQQADARNWGYAGDLELISNLLRDANAALGVQA